jgi:hypothetical protein
MAKSTKKKTTAKAAGTSDNTGSNWMLKRFHKGLALKHFPDGTPYRDRVNFRKKLNGVSTLEATRSIEGVNVELFDAYVAEFINACGKVK